MNENVAEYLEELAAKVRNGTHEITLERTDFFRAEVVEVDPESGYTFSYEGDVVDTMFQETFKVVRLPSKQMS